MKHTTKTKIHKLLSILMALCMMISLMPVSVLAADGEEHATVLVPLALEAVDVNGNPVIGHLDVRLNGQSWVSADSDENGSEFSCIIGENTLSSWDLYPYGFVCPDYDITFTCDGDGNIAVTSENATVKVGENGYTYIVVTLENNDCEHTYNWYPTDEAGHYNKCDNCQYTDYASFAPHVDENSDFYCDCCWYVLPHDHVYEEYTSDESYHYESCTICAYSDSEKGEEHGDDDEDLFCDVCNRWMGETKQLPLVLKAVDADCNPIEGDLDAKLNEFLGETVWVDNHYNELNDRFTCLVGENLLDFCDGSYVPDGYTLPDDITFTCDADGTIEVTSENAAVEVVDGVVYFVVTLEKNVSDEPDEPENIIVLPLVLKAVDADGNPIEGALDAKLNEFLGQTVWVNNEYNELNDRFTCLVGENLLDFCDGSYVPDGYRLPEDIFFTCDKAGNIEVTSENAAVEVVDGVVYFVVTLEKNVSDEPDEPENIINLPLGLKAVDTDGNPVIGDLSVWLNEQSWVSTYSDDEGTVYSCIIGENTLSGWVLCPFGFVPPDYVITFTCDEDGTIEVTSENATVKVGDNGYTYIVVTLLGNDCEHTYHEGYYWREETGHYNACDLCDYADTTSFAEHIDKDDNYICDLCTYELPHEHFDKDENYFCDVCWEVMPHEHTYEGGNYNYNESGHYNCCDICGDIDFDSFAAHEDENEDWGCDICQCKPMPHDCVDNKDNDGICDLCGGWLGETKSMVLRLKLVDGDGNEVRNGNPTYSDLLPTNEEVSDGGESGNIPVAIGENTLTNWRCTYAKYELPEDITFTCDENGKIEITSGKATVEYATGGHGIYTYIVIPVVEKEMAIIRELSVIVDNVVYPEGSGNIIVTPDTKSVVLSISGENFQRLLGQGNGDLWLEFINQNPAPISEAYFWVIDVETNTATYDITASKEVYNGQSIRYTKVEDGEFVDANISLTYALASVTTGESVTYYKSLSDAIEAAPAGATVTLLGDVDEYVDIGPDKNIILDLNGKTLNVIVENYGTLTVKDSVGTGVMIKDGGVALTNHDDGVLIIESGTISNGEGDCAIWNDGTLIVHGGTVNHANRPIYNKGEVTINGGMIVGEQCGIDNYGTALINGGSIEGTLAAVQNAGALTVTGGSLAEGEYGCIGHWGGTIDLTALENADGYTIFNWADSITVGTELMLPAGHLLKVYGRESNCIDTMEAGTVWKHTHEYSKEWNYTAEEHWRVCECKAKVDEGVHMDADGDENHLCDVCGYNDEQHIWSDPTCEEPSVCTECGAIGEPAIGHNYVGKVTTEPTCTAEGVKTYTCTNDEKHIYTESIAKVDHAEVKHSAQAPTCEAIGWVAYVTCERCDYSTYKEIPATGHNYVGKVTTEPTCTAEGIKTYTCANDAKHTYTEPVAKLGHAEVQHSAQAATCEAIGWAAYVTCERCDYSTYKEVPALGHNYVGKVTTEPTCTAEGIKTYTCANDASHSYTEPVEKLGHAEVKHGEQAPTCELIGWAAYVTCERCDYSTYKEIPALGHNYVGKVTKEPTCTAEGIKTYTCANDSKHTYTEPVAKLGHAGVKHSAQAPTCELIGWAAYVTCERCDYSTYKEIPAIGHNYVGKVTTEPTCTAEGIKTYTCANDASHSYTETIVKVKHTEETIPAVEANCTETGLTAGVKCSVCGGILTAQQIVPAKGHVDADKNFVCDVCGGDLCVEHSKEIIPAVAPTCEATGLTEGAKCGVCGEILTAQQTVPAKGHSPAEAVHENTVPATCAKAGSYDAVVYCTVCGTELSRETKGIPATGNHTAGSAVTENKVDASCTTDGKYDLVTYCSVCEAELSRVTAPVAAGHVDGDKDGMCDACGTATETPDVPEVTPDVPEVTPDVPEVTPDVPEVTPDVPEVTPDVPEVTPDVPEVTPNVPEVTPDVPEVTPDVPEVTPDVPEVTPDVPEVTPDVPEVTPDVPEVTPDVPEVTPDVPVEHKHDWSITAEGSVISAVCVGAGGCEDGVHTVVLRAPVDAVYDGTAKYAVVEGSLPAGELSDVIYSAEPVNAGYYTAVVSVVGTELAASVTYTIAPKALPAEGVQIEGNVVWNGEEQTVTVITPEGVTVEVSGNTATNVGVYEITVSGSGNYSGELTLEYVVEPDTALLDGITAETVNSDNREAVNKALEMMQNAEEYPDEPETAEAWKQLAADAEALNNVLNETEAAVDAADKALEALDSESVSSDDAADIAAAVDAIEALLAGGNLTEAERTELQSALEQAEALEQAIEDAANAAETEHIVKVENITADNVALDNRSDLEQAKSDLEQALTDNGGNYTETERAELEAALERIDGAIASVERVETVNETLSGLPADVTFGKAEDEKAVMDAWSAYGELSEHEKTLVDSAEVERLEALMDALKLCAGDVDKCPSAKYVDVDASKWYHFGVDYAVVNGYMVGVSDTKFAPDSYMTRAMMVQILYNMQGSPAVSGEDTFADTIHGEWYTDAILWAVQNGIAAGYSESKFGPNDIITREQMMTMFYQYCGLTGYNVSDELSEFADADSVSEYAVPALNWAVQNGMLAGFPDGTLRPAAGTTRAQMATVLMRFVQGMTH